VELLIGEERACVAGAAVCLAEEEVPAAPGWFWQGRLRLLVGIEGAVVALPFCVDERAEGIADMGDIDVF
jgi:hypothetical protein